jgi:hypothetical protein
MRDILPHNDQNKYSEVSLSVFYVVLQKKDGSRIYIYIYIYIYMQRILRVFAFEIGNGLIWSRTWCVETPINNTIRDMNRVPSSHYSLQYCPEMLLCCFLRFLLSKNISTPEICMRFCLSHPSHMSITLLQRPDCVNVTREWPAQIIKCFAIQYTHEVT